MDKNFSVRFIDPMMVINQLGMSAGVKAADFGCGSGYFSVPLAQIIGNEGILYSLDVLPQSLESVESRAKILGLTNIITKRVNLEKENGSKLETNGLDWVILKDMLFQNGKKDVIIKEAYRVLKSGGRMLVVEWNENDSSVGPEQNLRIKKNDLVNLIQTQKFSIEKEVNAGDFHYGLVATK